MKKEKTFLQVAKELIDELKIYKDEYTPSAFARIKKLYGIAKTNKRKFVKEYKKLSGATDFDLPDIIYAES